MKYSEQQLNTIIGSMGTGLHGSFASSLADSYLVADSGNREIIIKAFAGLLDRVARFLDIESTFDEAKHEAFIERRMSILDKKLMQGHISQDDYESMVKALNEVTL
jgi:hypothetical protein